MFPLLFAPLEQVVAGLDGLPLLLAQAGAAKTALGYALTGLLVGAGLILVARPSHRLTIEERQKQNRRRKE